MTDVKTRGLAGIAILLGLTGCGGGLPIDGAGGNALRRDIPFAGGWDCAGQTIRIGDMTYAEMGNPEIAIVSIATYPSGIWDVVLMDGRKLTVSSLSDGRMTLTDKRSGNALPCNRR